MSRYPYGKLPATPSSGLRFSDVFNVSKLPPLPPGDFGHERGVQWPYFGNDNAGDCVEAAAYSTLDVWAIEMQKKINVSAASALKTYTAVTGYNPNPRPDQIDSRGNNITDQGTDMGSFAEYWQNTGLTDDDGIVHKVDARIQLEPGNVTQLFYALYLFDGVQIGWAFPQEWEDQLPNNTRLAMVKNPTLAGGHCTPAFGRINGNIATPSWQMLLQVTPGGYQQFNDESFAFMTKEKILPNGRTLSGLDYAQWRAEFALVNQLTFHQAHGLAA